MAIGQAVTNSVVNVRLGQASSSAPSLGTLAAGTTIKVNARVTGEAVNGNATWYAIDGNGFVWSGGCGPLMRAAIPNVVDLSHFNAVTDFAAARAAGVIGIIHKCTTDVSSHDPAYAARRKAAAQAGLLWGAYHWGTSAPVDQQLNNFLGAAQPDAHTLLALDFESSPGSQMTLAGARQFLQGTQARLGRKAVLYSGDTIKTELGSTPDAYFGSHRLWLPDYGANPTVQASWKSYWLWQYTDGTNTPHPVTVPGIPGNAQGCIDCDHYAGSEAQLRAEWAS